MWVDHIVKAPDTGHWYAVVRVDADGNVETMTYLSTATDAEIVAAIDEREG